MSAIVSFQVGKRNEANTKAFIHDLRERIHQCAGNLNGRWTAYESAIEEAFGSECRYGQIIKTFVTACLENAPSRPRKVHRRFTVIQAGRIH
jgi:hypothetical protein